MVTLPTALPFNLMITRWASILNPFITQPMLNGSALASITLSSGNNVINHLLDRKMQGWMITDQNAAAAIYRNAPLNSTTLTLNSSSNVTVNLWVF